MLMAQTGQALLRQNDEKMISETVVINYIKNKRFMKKILFMMGLLLSLGLFSACSSNEEEMDNDPSSGLISNKDSCISRASLYKEIMGEWQLVKAIPEGNTIMGSDYFCFYPDTSYTYHHVGESKTYQETFEIVEQDYWEVPTIDYKQLPTNYYLRLFRGADFYEDFPFVIEDNIMHINVCGPTYFYTAFMFERVK
jgi:hypothetical protein